VDNWNNITNSQNRVRKKSFGGTFCFSNCHIIMLDTGGLVFLVSGHTQVMLQTVTLFFIHCGPGFVVGVVGVVVVVVVVIQHNMSRILETKCFNYENGTQSFYYVGLLLLPFEELVVHFLGWIVDAKKVVHNSNCCPQCFQRSVPVLSIACCQSSF
jgi:hypothetical protein